MKRYLVFGGSIYYPAGGWNDFYSMHDEFGPAKTAAQKEFGEAYQWWHIFDVVEQKVYNND